MKLTTKFVEKAPMTVTEISDALGKDKGQISNICSFLSTEGKIIRSHRKEPWSLVEANLLT